LSSGISSTARRASARARSNSPIAASDWNHPYSREQAAFPAPWLKEHKFWPAVGRIDNVYGDRNPICTCVGMEAFSS